MLFDLSTCQFVGDGSHEFAVLTFGRYTRLSENDADATYPLCLRFGIHFPTFTSEDEPAIGHLRTRFSTDITGLVEPAQILAIISCRNGPAFWRELHRVMKIREYRVLAGEATDREIWYDCRIVDVLRSCAIAAKQSMPDFVPTPPPDSSAVSISLDDLPQEQFPGYELGEVEESPNRQGKWAYELKKHLRAGGTGEQPHRERVVLREDLRRVDPSLFKGQLGWTDPTIGFSIKPGRTSLQVAVVFDSGFRLDIDIYWIDFLCEEHAMAVSEKIIASYRGTPYDSAPTSAQKWTPNLPFYTPNDCTIVGNGVDEVYAYTFESAAQQAIANGSDHYPMKVGYTSGLHGAIDRIVSQFPLAIAHDVRLQFIGRCSNGRSCESKIHKVLRADNRRITTAPGKEWFSTSASEVATIFEKYAL
ncbi:MAG: GIY-YIG nuclease family protein [Aureliella sp.]